MIIGLGNLSKNSKLAHKGNIFHLDCPKIFGKYLLTNPHIVFSLKAARFTVFAAIIIFFVTEIPGNADPGTQDCWKDHITNDDINTLWDTAEKYYGNGYACDTIKHATNAKRESDDSYAHIENVRKIKLGSKLCLPPVYIGVLLPGESTPTGRYAGIFKETIKKALEDGEIQHVNHIPVTLTDDATQNNKRIKELENSGIVAAIGLNFRTDLIASSGIRIGRRVLSDAWKSDVVALHGKPEIPVRKKILRDFAKNIRMLPANAVGKDNFSASSVINMFDNLRFFKGPHHIALIYQEDKFGKSGYEAIKHILGRKKFPFDITDISISGLNREKLSKCLKEIRFHNPDVTAVVIAWEKAISEYVGEYREVFPKGEFIGITGYACPVVFNLDATPNEHASSEAAWNSVYENGRTDSARFRLQSSLALNEILEALNRKNGKNPFDRNTISEHFSNKIRGLEKAE